MCGHGVSVPKQGGACKKEHLPGYLGGAHEQHRVIRDLPQLILQVSSGHWKQSPADQIPDATAPLVAPYPEGQEHPPAGSDEAGFRRGSDHVVPVAKGQTIPAPPDPQIVQRGLLGPDHDNR